jgi:hypothetical protein
VPAIVSCTEGKAQPVDEPTDDQIVDVLKRIVEP